MEFYAAEMIRQMHYITGTSGVVFLWKAENVERVNKAIEQFSTVQAGTLDFEIHALKLYMATGDLFNKKD